MRHQTWDVEMKHEKETLTWDLNMTLKEDINMRHEKETRKGNTKRKTLKGDIKMKH